MAQKVKTIRQSSVMVPLAAHRGCCVQQFTLLPKINSFAAAKAACSHLHLSAPFPDGMTACTDSLTAAMEYFMPWRIPGGTTIQSARTGRRRAHHWRTLVRQLLHLEI